MHPAYVCLYVCVCVCVSVCVCVRAAGGDRLLECASVGGLPAVLAPIRRSVSLCACVGEVSAFQHTHTYLGLARTIYIYGVFTVILAGKSPKIRSYTVYIYGSGQPYTYCDLLFV